MRINPCKICGNQDFDYVFDGQDRMHYLPGVFKLYRCRQCRLMLVYPPLSGPELQGYYPSNYYSYENSRRVAPVKSFMDKILHFVMHPFQACNCLLYSKILDLNRDFHVRPKSRLLDVGCGDGRFLIERSRSGCACFGNDISSEALTRLKNHTPSIETRCGNLWEVGYPDNFFDAINMSHVIEHIYEVDKLLLEARRIIKSDGFLRIQVPNAASLTFFIFHKYWMPLEVPRHVYAFSIKNLKRLFQKAGFDVVCCRTAEGSFTFIASVFFTLASVLRRKIDFMRCERIWNSEILKLLFFPYAWIVNLFRLGDTAEFILRKKG